MPSVPIPMVSALVLGYLFVALVLKRNRHWLLSALVGACALQASIISLGQHYGVDVFRAVQPVTAVFIPPLAWLAFRVTATRPLRPERDAFQMTGPLVTLICAVYAPGALDLAVPSLYVGYGVALLLVVAHGVDGMPRTRLETGNTPVRIWGFMGVALFLSALIDVAVTVAHMASVPHWQPWMVSVGSACTLAMFGGLALSQSLTNRNRRESAAEAGTASGHDVNPDADAEIVARSNTLLSDHEIYLDRDLTLGRLSRRLGVPVKQLSAAINRVTHGNVSRYVNGFRIERACERLLAGESVAMAMDCSGFSTRSNFNREFRRVTGKSPSEWRDAATRC